MSWVLGVLGSVLSGILGSAVTYYYREPVQLFLRRHRETWPIPWAVALVDHTRRAFLYLGYVPARLPPTATWAGRYDWDEASQPPAGVSQWLGECARDLHARLGITPNPPAVRIRMSEDSSAADIGRRVCALLEASGRPVVYFDAWSMPTTNVHRAFLNNLAAWTGAITASVRKEDEPIEVMFSMADFSWRLRGWRHFGRLRPTSPKPALIIVGVERLRGPSHREDNDGARERAVRALEVIERARIPLLLIETGETPQATDDAYEALPSERLADITQRITEGERYEQDVRPDVATILDRAIEVAPQKFKELVKFTSRPVDASAHIYRQLVDTATVKACGTHDLEAARQMSCLIGLAALPRFPIPFPMLRELIYGCHAHLPDVLPAPHEALHFDNVPALKALLDLGVVRRLVPTNPIDRRKLYLFAGGIRAVALHHLDDEHQEVAQLARENLRRLVFQRLPAPPTALSLHLTVGGFEPSTDILGFVSDGQEGGELVLPLSPDLCNLVASAHRDRAEGHCSAWIYEWFDAAGQSHKDAFVYIGPTSLEASQNLSRIRVHVVSREGSGEAVARALEPYCEQILDIEGDAFRTGPGGSMDVLVRLKSPHALAELDDLHTGVRRLARRIAEGLDKHGDLDARLLREVEVSVQNHLRAGLDSRATATVVRCVRAGVQEDLQHAIQLDDWVRFDRQPPSAYGAAAPYVVRIGGPALGRIGELFPEARLPQEFLVRVVQSPASHQAFLTLKQLHLEHLVRGEGTASSSTVRGPTSRQMLRVASELELDIRSLRHGTFGEYLAHLDVPVTKLGITEGVDLAKIRHETTRMFREQLKEAGVTFKAYTGLSDELLADALGESEPAGQFGRDTPMMPKGFYDLVASPEAYHRFMRKHLYIPDADAALLALAHRCRAATNGSLRVLDLGTGTGAIAEKLLLSGFSEVDTVEPDQPMLSAWHALRRRRGWEGRGTDHHMEFEEFATRHEGVYDLVVSQGVHHHIPDCKTYKDGRVEDGHRTRFLELCHRILKPNGAYIVSDEFLFPFASDAERLRNLDKWYSRVIARALSDGLPLLAELEYGFWHNDRVGVHERKESVETFISRLSPEGPVPLKVRNLIRFGLSQAEGGGFAVLELLPTVAAD